jgi:glycosyltransferase involved in cell wall biosynthesis
MKISLITVCFNSARTIETAIESVLSQNGVDIEYIVIDGASQDGTVDVLKKYEPKFEGRMRWISEKDNGMYDALNKGISLATGDVVGILNSDDMFESAETLSCIVAAFEKDIDCIYGDIRFVKSDLQTTVRYYGARHWSQWMHNFGYMPPHPSVYIRRECFNKFGGYKLGYKISADFELMVRYLCRNRISVKYLPQCLVKMRMGGLSTRNWRSNILLNKENVRANRENGYFSCFLMMLPKYFFKIWGFIRI